MNVTILQEDILVSIINDDTIVASIVQNNFPGQAAIQFDDEGLPLGTVGTVTEVDFTGAGVTGSRSGAKVTYNVPGGGAVATADAILNDFDRRLLFPGTAQNVADQWSAALELSDGRIFLVTTTFGTSFADFTQLIIYGRYSSDGCKTFGTKFQIVGIEGSEVLNAASALYKKADGTLQLYFFRQLGVTNPIQTSLCRKQSSDNGATWGATSTIYTANYASPRSNNLLKCNNYTTASNGSFVSGTLLIAWNKWFAPNYDYSSAVGQYYGVVLKSTDDGATWAASSDISPSGGAVLEPQITQYADASDGTAGRVIVWYRNRSGFTAYFYSDDSGTTWSASALSTLISPNSDQTMQYFSYQDLLVATINRPPSAPTRRYNDIWVSYNQGGDWFKLMTMNYVPLSASYYTSSNGAFYLRGKLIFNYLSSNSDVSLIDQWIFTVPLSAIDAIKYVAIFRSSSADQSISGHWVTGGGGLLIDEVMLGNTAQRDPNSVLQITSLTAGKKPNQEIWDDKASNTGGKINFRKSRLGAAPSSNDDVGTISWTVPSNEGVQFRGIYNADGTVTVNIETDQTGGGMVTVGAILGTGEFILGGGNSFISVDPALDLIQFAASGKETRITLANFDNNTNSSWIKVFKQNGAYPHFNIPQDYYIGGIDLQGYYGGIGARFGGKANAFNPGNLRGVDFVWEVTNSVGGQLEALRLTGNGKFIWPVTDTAAGTTGNQTINKPMGSVNIAAGGSTVTVTNSYATTTSHIFVTIETADATAIIKNVVRSAGSFVINIVACTAETRIGFFVQN